MAFAVVFDGIPMMVFAILAFTLNPCLGLSVFLVAICIIDINTGSYKSIPILAIFAFIGLTIGSLMCLSEGLQGRNVTTPILMISAAAAIVCFYSVVCAIARLSRFTHHPLFRIICRTLSDDFRCECYVTAACEVTAVYPEKGLQPIPSFHPALERSALYTGSLAVPVYAAIHDNQTKTRFKRRFLLASAALPYGISPSVLIPRHSLTGWLNEYLPPKDEYTCCDGGVADNTPLLPLLAAGCTHILVIRLRTEKFQTDHHLETTASCLARADLPEGSIGSDKMMEPVRKAVLKSYQERLADITSRLSKPVILVPPGHDLGGFLDGTMRFDAERAAQLINWGEKQMNLYLQEPEAAVLLPSRSPLT